MPKVVASNGQSHDGRAREFPAMVAKVLDDYAVVINRGTDDGVKTGQNFLIYSIDDEDIVDPETGDSIGPLEIVRGRGTVTHVQARIATVKSIRKEPARIIKRRHPGGVIFGEVVEERDEGETLPFEDPEVGDKAKPL